MVWTIITYQLDAKIEGRGHVYLLLLLCTLCLTS